MFNRAQASHFFVLTRSATSVVHKQPSRNYISSAAPQRKPAQDLTTNTSSTNTPPPPPSLSSNRQSSSEVVTTSQVPSSTSSSDFVLLDEDISFSSPAVMDQYTPSLRSSQWLQERKPSVYDFPSSSSPLSHHFDTFALVERLQSEGGFTRIQARFLMEIMQEQIRSKVTTTKADLLSSAQLENDTHILNASIEDLRNAVTLTRKNDAALLKSNLNTIARDIENLEQHLNEDVNYLQNSIDLTLNDFRADIRQEQKVIMIETQQVNHRLTVMQADANMALERMKWETIWQSLLSIVITGMGLTMVGYGLSSFRSKMEPNRVDPIEIDQTLTVADMEL
ncbi:uncharacterized protein BX664DRAFT_343260 [Halteromyces radiatus]|uniref:uncharacterized protein n=1 Tax=Halteromyces radiatus TaxID=101107 RepID=UPI00222021FF|nr:uncharacterized protein BX664DRAFT_343260 [Halteromyces radiatus]KAI8077699.1 hypothetical protein BX664DRAFT_343260 [Halteromyces radiatus]